MISHTAAQTAGQDVDSELAQHRSGLFVKLSEGLDLGQHRENFCGGLQIGQFGQSKGILNGPEVHDRGLAGDQDEIGHLGGH